MGMSEGEERGARAFARGWSRTTPAAQRQAVYDSAYAKEVRRILDINEMHAKERAEGFSPCVPTRPYEPGTTERAASVQPVTSVQQPWVALAKVGVALSWLLAAGSILWAIGRTTT